ncbi:MAG: N-6 DNA methylase [Sulfuriferula sp.]
MGAEGVVREKLLERDLIETMIGFAPNLFYGSKLAVDKLSWNLTT